MSPLAPRPHSTALCQVTHNQHSAGSFNNQQLTSGSRFLISSSGDSLRILSAQQTDEGAYVCEAVNQVGRDSAAATVDVQGKSIQQLFRSTRQLKAVELLTDMYKA